MAKLCVKELWEEEAAASPERTNKNPTQELYKLSRRHDVTIEITRQNFEIKAYPTVPFTGDSAWKAQHLPMGLDST